MSAIAILGELNHRYLIVGSTAIQLHGFNWGQRDIDAWLDPTIPVDEWDALVNRRFAAPSKDLESWRRQRTRWHPALDPNRQQSQTRPYPSDRSIPAERFRRVFDRSLISELGNVAPSMLFFE